MTKTEYETKRKFVEEQLAVLVNSIDSRILALKYKKTDAFEWVIAHYPSDASQINVSGMSNLEITLNVLSAIFNKNPRCRIQSVSVDGLVYDLKALKGRLNGVGNDIDRLLYDIGEFTEVTPL